MAEPNMRSRQDRDGGACSQWLSVAAVATVIATAALIGGTITAKPARSEPALESAKLKRPKSELDYMERMDKALSPLMSVAPTEADAAGMRNAIDAIKTNNLSRLAEISASIADPTAKKFVQWAQLRSGYGQAAEYRQFLQDNPLWPDRTMLVQRMEEALFTQGGSAASIKDYFKSAEPKTGIGMAALGSAHLAEGNTAEARKHAARAWRDMTIPGTLETGFLRRFSTLLTADDHKWRFDRMVTDDVRWAGNRADRAAFARRIIPLLPAAEQKKASARLAVFTKSASAKALMAALPADAEDLGLAFHRAQLLRKDGKVEDAAKIILSIPPDPEKIAVLDEWWAERRQLAFGALKANNAKLAYKLASDAGPLTVNPLKEQTFMAGWIAWRYLKDETTAERHFKAFADAADGPLSRAKAAYWLGRLAESRGDTSAMTAHYTSATKNPDTFHGLLAMQKLEPGRTSLPISPPEFPSNAQISTFIDSDAAKAVVIARKAKLSREYTRGFLTSLRIGLPTEADAAMVAHLAEAIGDTQMSLRVAKAAIAKGQNLIVYGYPIHTFPAFRPLRQPPEMAFMLGITRQETEFEPNTVSGAGAKGLMQVMTITAKHVCRDYKIKCDIPRLMTDTSYNASIASAYIADRMGEFGGSYVLGLAGYNAGPGRARQWIRENGDPRNSKIDPVDWIERIPITETREYVAKVLANIQIYRARIGDETEALRLEEDLARARGSSKTPGDSSDENPAEIRSENTEG